MLHLLSQPIKDDVFDAFAISPGPGGRGQLPPLGWSQQRHAWPSQINPIPAEKRDAPLGDQKLLTLSGQVQAAWGQQVGWSGARGVGSCRTNCSLTTALWGIVPK